MNNIYTSHTKKNILFNNIKDIPNIDYNTQEGGKIRVKKFIKKLFKTKKSKKTSTDKPIKILDKKYSIRKVGYHNYSKKKDDINDFINYILYYNPNYTNLPNEFIINIAKNITSYKKEYYSLYKKNILNRKYKLLPSIDYIYNLYKTTKNLRLFFNSFYEYICIVAIFENIIHNILYSNISNTFIVENSNYVKYGLKIFDDKVSLYLPEHNPIFVNLFKCRISLSALDIKKQKIETKPTEIPKIEQKTPDIKPENTIKVPVNNDFYNAFMYIPGVYEPMASTNIKKGGGKGININKKYLEIINKKIVIANNEDIKEKINIFYKNNYTSIDW
jgi:hypothetical protein